jgi:hypothetical protein
VPIGDKIQLEVLVSFVWLLLVSFVCAVPCGAVISSLVAFVVALACDCSLRAVVCQRRLLALAVALSLVLLHHCSRRHFLGTFAVAAGRFSLLLNVFVLALFLWPNAAKMPSFWHGCGLSCP